MTDNGDSGDRIVRSALAELVNDAPPAPPVETLDWPDSSPRPGRASSMSRRLLVACAAVALAGSGLLLWRLLSPAGEVEVAVQPDITTTVVDPPATTPETSVATTSQSPEAATSALRRPTEPYLPSWVPEGFTLTAITWQDEPEAYRLPEASSSTLVRLGDDAELSNRSLTLTAHDYDDAADLDEAVYIANAMKASFGGDLTDVSIGSTQYLLSSFGEEPFIDFHGVVGTTLIEGLAFGEFEQSELARLLSSLSVRRDAGGLSLELDGASIDLTTLAQVPPAPMSDSYELTYSNGAGSFLVTVNPGADRSMLTQGAVHRVSPLLERAHGSGFIEAQPEVGRALGSRRLRWWVPTAYSALWFGDVIDDETAVTVADSVIAVDNAEWDRLTEGIETSVIDFGVVKLPEDPAAMIAERLAERDRDPDELGERPDLDLADIRAFVGERRKGELPASAGVTWIGPAEAYRNTAGAAFVPEGVWQVLRATGAVTASDDREDHNEARRTAVRGVCCDRGGIVLLENMGIDEATVVAAHEMTHLYDITVLGATRNNPRELVDPGSALWEGNATRIMRDYRDERGLSHDLDTRSYETPAMPIAVQRLLRFAYLDGEVFARSVANDGGEAAIDRALLDDGPTSTEQILHPDRYLSGDEPRSVAAPTSPVDAVVTQSGTIGAFPLALAAERAVGWDRAVELVGSWAGDGFVAWTSGDDECLRATIEMDDAASAVALADALGGSATGSTIGLETCG